MRTVESQLIPCVVVKLILLNSSVSFTSTKRERVTSNSGE